MDCVLTFAELDDWLKEAGVTLEPAPQDDPGGRTRLYPTTGGILSNMEKQNRQYTYLTVDGVENCIDALHDIASGQLKHCFVEMSACTGSCVSGPGMTRQMGLLVGVEAVDEYTPDAGEFEVAQPDEKELDKAIGYNAPPRRRFGEKAISEVLRKIGKTKPEDELNCGSCGYETCRDKAQAVLEGKADLTMCMPYLMNKAQSFSDTIIRNTPNAIIVLSEALEIQQLNAAACRLLNVQDEGDVLGRNVSCVMDPADFLPVLEEGPDVIDKRLYLAEYDRYILLSVIRDSEYDLIIGIMRDVSEAEAARAARREVSDKTIAVTDKVIEKHMRIVQEIASLLGETAAET
ncbi:PAS domain-containing protein, partial [Ruminococcaceae bacterium OttesenSCG-928-D13]|nr:PAS domain-containing protein [Ruminococcaceae bacterium OttesenSCG-928-D13]